MSIEYYDQKSLTIFEEKQNIERDQLSRNSCSQITQHSMESEFFTRSDTEMFSSTINCLNLLWEFNEGAAGRSICINVPPYASGAETTLLVVRVVDNREGKQWDENKCDASILTYNISSENGSVVDLN